MSGTSVRKIFHPVLRKVIKVKKIKVVTETVTDAKGDSHKVKFAEFTVLGRSGRRWKDAIPLDDFEKTNSEVKI